MAQPNLTQGSMETNAFKIYNIILLTKTKLVFSFQQTTG